MFTGIIESVGKVRAAERAEKGLQLSVQSQFTDVQLGESIAVNGVCLTATEVAGGSVNFFASAETLARTNLGELHAGDAVNLERAVQLQSRLSGHLVQGHVDGLARLAAVKLIGEAYELHVELPAALRKYVVEKGSIALDGISLTVNSIENSTLYLMIIPHTWSHTNLASKKIGQDFNVEVDVVAKYVESLSKYAQYS